MTTKNATEHNNRLTEIKRILNKAGYKQPLILANTLQGILYIHLKNSMNQSTF